MKLMIGDIVKHEDGRIGVFSNFRDQPEMGGFICAVFFPSNRESRFLGRVRYCRHKELTIIGSIYEQQEKTNS